MTELSGPEELLDFPCQFTFKALGVGSELFSLEIIQAVSCYAIVHQDAIQIRPSGKGDYQSVSIIVNLENYKQLTDIYAEMRNVSGLKMLL